MTDSLIVTGVRPIQTEEGIVTVIEGWNDYEQKEKHFCLEEELYSVVTFYGGEDRIFWEVFDHGEKFKNEEAEKNSYRSRFTNNFSGVQPRNKLSKSPESFRSKKRPFEFVAVYRQA